MGLQLLGRGTRIQSALAGLSHLLGAAAGGAIVGATLGWVGSALYLPAWRIQLLAGFIIVSLRYSLMRPMSHLGLQCQVPRMWRYNMASIPRYILWGALLGCDVATVIPYTSFIVLLGVQATSGLVIGAVSGALYGSARELASKLVSIGLEQAKRDESPELLQLLIPLHFGHYRV
jgi:hypothetical protein